MANKSCGSPWLFIVATRFERLEQIKSLRFPSYLKVMRGHTKPEEPTLLNNDDDFLIIFLKMLK